MDQKMIEKHVAVIVTLTEVWMTKIPVHPTDMIMRSGRISNCREETEVMVE